MIWLALATVAFQHIVIVVQENRTPDNLFYALCQTQVCSDDGSVGYDIKQHAWLTNGGTIEPQPTPLAGTYDMDHSHPSFTGECDVLNGACQMDGAALVKCYPATSCPPNPQFRYIDNSTGQIQPYLDMATEYGWANQMYQTNQGPSFPAHQFLFGATSALSQLGDAGGTFMAENGEDGFNPLTNAGCASASTVTVQLIGPHGKELRLNTAFPCAEHQTLSDLMDGASQSWRYYATGVGIWTAPDAISHICEAANQQCTGAGWNSNVDLTSADILTDISNCNLRSLVWATPSGQNSDHAGINDGGGPSWVDSIVTAIGQSPCTNPDGSSYWASTAVIVTWDDWGGWYDHEAPQFLSRPQGGYQMGFRVPLIFISAYTPPMIDSVPTDFGSIARFVEQNFGIAEGALGFADSRASSDLTEFVALHKARAFVPIKAPKNAAWFINDKRPQTAPDDD
jgi:phospholipase C